MGAWEAAKRAVKDNPDLTVSISSANIQDNIIRVTDRKRTAAFSFSDDMPEFQIEDMVKMLAKRLTTKKAKRSAEYLEKIEDAMGIRLEAWQAEYILSDGIGHLDGRRTGKTLAHQLKTLLISDEPLEIYADTEPLITDEEHGNTYRKMYIEDLIKLQGKLKKRGIETREIVWHRGARRAKGIRNTEGGFK